MNLILYFNNVVVHHDFLKILKVVIGGIIGIYTQYEEPFQKEKL